jgi:hypothetical protein
VIGSLHPTSLGMEFEFSPKKMHVRLRDRLDPFGSFFWGPFWGANDFSTLRLENWGDLRNHGISGVNW